MVRIDITTAPNYDDCLPPFIVNAVTLATEQPRDGMVLQQNGQQNLVILPPMRPAYVGGDSCLRTLNRDADKYTEGTKKKGKKKLKTYMSLLGRPANTTRRGFRCRAVSDPAAAISWISQLGKGKK